MTCKDNSITYLKNSGYSVVRVPKEDIQPLQIFINEKGILKPLGDLSTILKQGEVALPQVQKDKPVAGISGTRSSDLSAGIALSILGSIVGAMGGSKLGLEGKYEKAKSISFEFSDVYEDSISIANLDQYLADADVNPLSRYVADLLEADEIYLTTATIKTNKINIDGKEKSNASLTVDIPEIQKVIGGNINVKAAGGKTNQVTFEGKIALVFGFQAIQLVYEDGRYKTFKHLKAGEGAVSGFGDEQPKYLSQEGAFVKLAV